MNKFYFPFCVISILILLFFACFSYNSKDIRHQIVLVSSLTDDKVWIKRRKTCPPARKNNIIKTYCYIYLSTLRSHFFKAFLGSFLCFSALAKEYSLIVGLAIFIMSSLTTLSHILGCHRESKIIKKLSYLYLHTFQVAYKTVIIILLYVIGVKIYLFVIGFISGNTTNFLAVAPLGCLHIKDMEEKDFSAKYNCDTLKVEENKEFYKITLGEVYWVIRKDNQLNRVIFAVLLYAAVPTNGNKFITSAEELANALGWEKPGTLRYFYNIYKKDGLLSSVFAQGIRFYLSKIKYLALEVHMREGFGLSPEEIQEKLKQQGHHFSAEKIYEALSVVNFNTHRKHFHSYFRRRSKYDKRKIITKDNLQIELIDNHYCIRAGKFYWEIEKENRFLWISLLFLLNKATDVGGKQLATLVDLTKMTEFNSHRHLQQFFKKFENIQQNYQQLKNVGKQHNKNIFLTQKMQELWLEDISQGPGQIAKRMVEKGYVKSMCRTTARFHMRNIDFIELREQLARDYKKGKYSRSTQWVSKKYREIIDQLLQQLEDGKLWSKAQIEKFIADLPRELSASDKEQKTSSSYHSTKAWLKCFLFNLPKSHDNKICCPQCGRFETGRKSKIPQPQIITDPKTGESEVVNIFRFYCKNQMCELKTFSATGEGSHILHEEKYAKACMMLRLVMGLRGSYRAAADILGVSKSFVYQQLTQISLVAMYWDDFLNGRSFSGTICIDEKFVKIAQLRKTKGNRPFAYLFFAVDPLTYDLLHIEIYYSRNNQAVIAFLTELKTKGIFPEVIMTDLFSGYDTAIREVYGRSVTIAKCHFHFKKNISKHMTDQFGKKDVPEVAKQLQKEIFNVVDAKAKKTIRKRYGKLLEEKNKYLTKEPGLGSMFKCLDNYLPDLLRVIEHERVWLHTNNPCELVIRHFNQRYKLMGGFDSLETAQRHARLFQIVHRFTPLSDDVEDVNKRGRAPLELAGYKIRHMPIFQYLTEPLLFNMQPAKTLALLKKKSA